MKKRAERFGEVVAPALKMVGTFIQINYAYILN